MARDSSSHMSDIVLAVQGDNSIIIIVIIISIVAVIIVVIVDNY